MKGQATHFANKRRKKQEYEDAVEKAHEDMAEELEYLGYSDKQIDKLDDYISTQAIKCIRQMGKELDPKLPYEWIQDRHERGDIE